MLHVPASIEGFLRSRCIAVVGVSRNRKEPSSLIFERLRSAGLPVVAVNPHLTVHDDMPCYPDLASIPKRPDAVLIATHPTISPSIVRACGDLGIRKVWFHRSLGDGSWSPDASRLCSEAGIEAIEGGCPMMFVEPVDLGHACMRWLFQRTGKVPKG